MTIRQAINTWAKETGGQIKRDSAINTLTMEFSHRLSYPFAKEGVTVKVYAQQPCAAAAAIYVSVSLSDGSSTAMKLIQFEAAVRCPGGKRYEKWHLCRPSKEIGLYLCADGKYAKAHEDFDLSAYVEPMVEYLTNRCCNFQKCCKLLADTFGSDFVKELQTRDGKPLETYCTKP